MLDDNSRGSAAPAQRGRGRHRIHRRRHPRRRRGRRAAARAWTRCITSPSSTAPSSSTAQPELVLDVGVRGMINVIDACRKHDVGTLILASSSEVYQTPPKIPTDESAPLVGARSAQPALFLRRRQAHQRADGDQFRPQIFRARADLPPAQCLRPRHGLRARDAAVRAAPACAGDAAARPAGSASRSRAPARRPAASASSTIWSPASW